MVRVVFVCVCAVYFMINFYFSTPFIIFTGLVLVPPSRNSDPGSHSRLFSPLPTAVRALHFYREKDSALSAIVDWRRIVPTHAIIGALDSSCCFENKKLHTEIRTHDINASGVRA